MGVPYFQNLPRDPQASQIGLVHYVTRVYGRYIEPVKWAYKPSTIIGLHQIVGHNGGLLHGRDEYKGKLFLQFSHDLTIYEREIYWELRFLYIILIIIYVYNLIQLSGELF